MGLANQITLFRLALGPLFVAVFILGGTTGYVLALIVAVLVEATDFLDGYLARAKREISDFGKLVDPMADSLARFSVFLCFLWGGYAHLWMVALLFYRDFVVAYMRIAAAHAGMVMAARLSGKLKAVTQAVAIIAILILIVATPAGDPERVEATRRTAHWLMGLVVLVTVWSGIDYVWSASPILRQLLRRRS
ncbi:MAG: CDP-diacylglycerol--glycerol-3-phosphate 3-phosphatidyltransferase [Candidatus Brocadiia bacterium]